MGRWEVGGWGGLRTSKGRQAPAVSRLLQLDEHEAGAAQHIARHLSHAHHQVGWDEQLPLFGIKGEGAHVASRALAQLNLDRGERSGRGG